MFGAMGLATTADSTVTRYLKGQPLRQGRPELQPTTSENEGWRTMAIRMPQQRIAEYVDEHLQWLPLLTDEELVARLETVLLARLDNRAYQPTNRLRIADLLGGPLFKTLGSQLQDRILEKLEELEKRRRY